MLLNIYSTIIEYVATVWSPHTQCNIHSIEMIQQKAARFVFNDFARLSSVSTMLELLGWDSLEKRRDQLTLMMLFKIINNHLEISYSHILIDSPSFTRSTASKFIHLYARIDSYKFSFFP